MSTIKFNVAQLLREIVGGRREYTFTEESLPLDNQLVLRSIRGEVRFTRTVTGVYARVRARGMVELICVRSLEPFDHLVELDFSDEFHSTVDVMTGVGMPKPEEDDPYLINELHMADIGDAIRDYTILDLPISPVSPAYRDTPVSYTVQSDDIDDDQTDDVVDSRFEALKAWAAQQNNNQSRS
ncbi:DUF177 domain-containing protein [Oscillochloris sp. ZM17-4]|nr:DUF177 domain-containing protein [Oscillochloris sp. ZM17-4]MBX0326859.1 DUF177 domain-containing protein [Oscillochloris sp. ZM17-4]